MPSRDSVETPRGGVGAAVFVILFAVYLLSGAAVTVVIKSWPAFLPPQFDWIAIFVWAAGPVAGVYISGAVLGLLGFAFLLLGVKAVARRRHA